MPEDRQVFPEHSVEDNLLIAAKNGPDGRRDWTLPRIWETFPLLAKLRARDAGRLSGGEQQLLVIARALLGNPKVLLMDEPSEGLAPVVVEHLVHAIRAVAAERSMAILLVEQRIDVALDLADRYVIMDRGRIVSEGATDDLRERQDELPAMMGLA